MTTATGSVTITVVAPNPNQATGTITFTIVQAPVANPASFSTPFNTALNGSLVSDASDPNVPALPITFSVVTTATNGTISLSPSGTFTYAPSSTFSGTDSFTYKVNNGYLYSPSATVTITVGASAGAPVAQNITFSLALNGTINTSISQFASSPQGYTLSFSLATTPTHGTATLTAVGIFTYTPTTGYSGSDTCSYTVTDGHGGSATAQITINISGSIQPPPPVASPPNVQVTILNAQPGDYAVVNQVNQTSFFIQIMNNGVGVQRNVNWVASAF